MSRIVLLGSGQSGSTLLGMCLALSPSVSMLGEISELRRADPVQHTCTCGRSFGDCLLWGRMYDERLHLRAYDSVVLARALALAREVDETELAIDSCKGTAALDAQIELGLEAAKILYLVRHPCGYVYSQLSNGLELEYALDAWIYDQTCLLHMLSDWGKPWLLVRYEDFARAPGAELGRLGAALEIPGPHGERGDPWGFEQTPWGVRQHVLSGASWRFGGRPKIVREDVRWRHALASSAIEKIVCACTPLLEQLGYVDQNL